MEEKLKIKGDPILWTVVLLLFIVSLLTVYSATGSLAWKMGKEPGYYLVKQIVNLVVGLGMIYAVHRMNYTYFAKISSILIIISIPLLIYTLFFGTTLNEGSRWLRIPGVGFTIQTSDLAKLALFTYLAKTLSIRQKEIKSLSKGFRPLLFPVALTCILIAPANLSTAMVLGLTSCIIFYLGRVRVKHIIGLMIIIVSLLVVVFLASKATGWGRADTWESRIVNYTSNDEDKYANEKNYQVTQAAIAIAGGGTFGRGPGNSWARDYLPHPYSDFIFAIIIEEYGIIGGLFTVSCYLVFLWRSILIFRKTPYAFGGFLALALSFTLVFQAFINMAVTVQLFPVTGLTLPLVSMGGSSILFTSISVGIILSVSRHADALEIKMAEMKKQKTEPLQVA
ncbi:MAG TPA: FtsW/RodA/SpoVE family cell cycle protein [Chitinophagaceae bacterium]|nr:FtsW/RodA/SpoVE family cell cycle protein [Chitinophagaceae bacterium]